ncbi:sporulation protein YunB [Pseudoflavonifractor phocaeensis]|uniref:sporulation protein YunB n=1 Tax=Pseudoflavonifractor phocaeensis TaxID=1870988 RepID=UPI001F33FF93|nr:sporulation protein YunB [Pseudoflavonifractor phocaeensis]MCF2662290.1 sporulation protein YunB [Pseudoflavonifractor phocaeensis]
MAGGRAGRELERRARRAWHRPRTGRGAGRPPLWLTLAAALAVAFALIRGMEDRLGPNLTLLARTQLHNQVSVLLEQTVSEALTQGQVDYGDLVDIRRDQSGAILSLTTDTAALNRLRTQLASQVLEALDSASATTVRIPLGSLLGGELTWARGPALTVRAVAAGTVSAQFESEFSSAGVNQTIHRLELALSIPMTVLLPGGGVEETVALRLPVAETVIVGQVPEAYLQTEGLPASG